MIQQTLNVQVTIKNHQGQQETEEQLLKWIQGCLNCNTNRVSVEVAPATPVVVVEMEGGVIQSTCADASVHLLVLDRDVEGSEESDLVEVAGDLVYVINLWPDLDESFVDEVLHDVCEEFSVWHGQHCHAKTFVLEEAYRQVRLLASEGKSAHILDSSNRVIELPEPLICAAA